METEGKPAGPADGAGRRRGLVEADILEVAAQLFAARGFAATSMQDIAAALGTSRPALYHYFPGKEAILARLIDGLAEATSTAVEQAAGPGPADERLDRLVRALIAPIAAAPGRFRLILTSDLAEEFRGAATATDVRRLVVNSVGEVIADGMASGVFRRCDQRVATFAILGMINWVAWWYSESRGPAVDALGDSLADLAVASLRAPGGERAGTDAAAVLASIRRDLDFLERHLA
ncbi:TetR/AcrR family transcriptional regulator [Dactylosporangium sp. CA-092794]|uniref:TetR/AcrR family transcriptional regulator n=1 Tax=Dactylosporangium sp. CA-092794 TaxID=3239929 RepID=UPI003D91B3C5